MDETNNIIKPVKEEVEDSLPSTSDSGHGDLAIKEEIIEENSNYHEVRIKEELFEERPHYYYGELTHVKQESEMIIVDDGELTHVKQESKMIIAGDVGWVSGEYLGCYEDKGGKNRLMNHYMTYLNEINTPKKCTYLCTRLGYGYAGVQDGVQCFCSDVRPSKSKKRNEDECNMTCPGNNEEICGGPWRLSVYSGDVNPPPNAVYMGCYEDTARRLLADIRFEHQEVLTPKKCINLCKSFGFPYAGLETMSQCYCSKLRPDDDKRKSDSECNEFCPQTKHRCGDRWRLSVYTFSVDNVTQLEISDDTVEKTYLGCFEDLLNQKRLISEYRIDLYEINTPKKCIYICKQLGFDYAGVENGNECYCGNERPASDLKRNGNDCSVSCPFREQKCGGPSRLAVYSIEYP